MRCDVMRCDVISKRDLWLTRALQWTVSGQLRIGFFSIRDIEAGDEITFDYKFERYGCDDFFTDTTNTHHHRHAVSRPSLAIARRPTAGARSAAAMTAMAQHHAESPLMALATNVAGPSSTAATPE